jgi:hypothetical protein
MCIINILEVKIMQNTTRYDDKYVLIAEYSQGNRSGSMKVVKSIAAYISEEGEVLVPLVKKEVDQLRNNLLKSD